jgi:hypothetical protein
MERLQYNMGQSKRHERSVPNSDRRICGTSLNSGRARICMVGLIHPEEEKSRNCESKVEILDPNS